MLEVAARVFSAQGYHVASMDEIAAGAGISKPMLYAYFGSKKGLYLATIDQAGRHLVETVETIRRTGPAGGKMAAGIAMMMRFIDRYRAGWTVLFQASETDAEVAGRVAGYRRALVDAAAAGLTDLAEVRGTKLNPTDAEPWAHALLGAGEALARWWLAHPGETATDMSARIERVVRGLGVLPATGAQAAVL